MSTLEMRTRPIAQLDAAGNIVAQFVYASDRNTPSLLIKNGETYRIISDHTGSPRVIIHTGTGAIMQQLDFDEYGNVTNDTNPGFQTFGFMGGLLDRDTGLTHTGGQDYDAEVGRTIAKKPTRFGRTDADLSDYIVNDPVNTLDIGGLEKDVPTATPLPPSPTITYPPSPTPSLPAPPTQPPNPADLNGDGVVNNWDWALWAQVRALWNLLTPPGMPFPPGYGDDGPGSNAGTTAGPNHSRCPDGA
jgi:RHS repeat-associated protein